MKLCIAVAAIILLSACQSTDDRNNGRISNLQRDFAEENGLVMVVAHRTCWKNAPENSLQGIDDCVSSGVDMIEIDVQRTKDDQLILLHDDTVDRTTNGTGAVVDMTLAEVKKLRLLQGAGGSGARLTDQRIPTLAEAYGAARGALLINVDAKGALHADALALARAESVEPQILLKSSYAPGDERLAFTSTLKRAYFMPIIGQCTESQPRAYCPTSALAGIDAFDAYPNAAYEVVFSDDQFFRSTSNADLRGRRLWVNTLQPHHASGRLDRDGPSNPDRVWGELVEMGADIIQTDEPEALVAYLHSKGLHRGPADVAKR